MWGDLKGQKGWTGGRLGNGNRERDKEREGGKLEGWRERKRHTLESPGSEEKGGKDRIRVNFWGRDRAGKMEVWGGK